MNRFTTYQGYLLRTLRTDRGMLLRDVSASAHIALGYLSEVERGMKIATPDVVESICAAYGVRHSDFLRKVADTMDLFDEDVLDWTDENPMSNLDVPAWVGAGQSTA